MLAEYLPILIFLAVAGALGVLLLVLGFLFAPRKPDLNIIDAYRILRKNGPQGRAKEDGELAQYQMLGTDMVAMDAAAAKLYGMKPEDLGFVKIAGEMGAGQADLAKVKIKRITLET